MPKDAADTTAKWEPLGAIGVDSILREHPGVDTKFIDYALDYIFGGTTKYEFFKEAAETFARTGTLEKKNYCNFSDLWDSQIKKTFRELTSSLTNSNTFPNYILYDNTAYTPKGCAGDFSRPIPKFIVNNVARKCFGIPYCTSDLKDSIRIGEYKTDTVGIGNFRFICRETGWDTREEPCMDKGRDYASKNDIEMSKTECTTDGQTKQSETDLNMYYVCQDGNWSEFYNRPCDTDNKRIKIVNEKVATNFTECICYNKTWRPTYEWRTDYPALLQPRN